MPTKSEKHRLVTIVLPQEKWKHLIEKPDKSKGVLEEVKRQLQNAQEDYKE